MILVNRFCAKEPSSSGSGIRFARIISHIQNHNPRQRFKRLQAQTNDQRESDIAASYLSRDPLPTSINNVSIQDPLPTLAMVSASVFNALLTASNGPTLACYGQNPPSRPQLTPLTYSACKQAFQTIPMHEKAYAPIIFSRNPDAGFRVPHTWSHGGCVVRIDTLAADVEETTTFADVFMRAFELSAECVIKPPHLGGESLLGATDMLEIAIMESSERRSSYGTKNSKGGVGADGGSS